MQITIEKDALKKLDVFLTRFNDKALTTAFKKASNTALRKLSTQANKQLRTRRKLKKSEIKSDYFTEKKAFGTRLTQMRASLEIASKPISLIRFLKGNKSPRPQSGIPVKKRKLLKIEIVPGKTVRTKAFIAKGRNNNNHLFRRRTKNQTPIVKQATKALSVVVTRNKLRRPLERFAGNELNKEFTRVFKVELDKIQPRTK